MIRCGAGHWVRRDRGGRIVLRFEPIEAETLIEVVADLRTVLEEGAGDDPVSRRLFPRAYLDPTEEEAGGPSGRRSCSPTCCAPASTPSPR